MPPPASQAKTLRRFIDEKKMRMSNLFIVSLLTCICGSQAFGQIRDAKPQPTPTAAASPQPRREAVYYTIRIEDGTINSYVPDAANFLADPVATLRQNGFAVPTAAERHWQSLSVALRRLSNPKLPSSRTSLVNQTVLKNEILRLQLPHGSIPIVGDWNGDGTISVGDFLSDPIGSLQAQGVNIRAADEPAWRQLAAALKALRHVYASSETQPEPARDRFYRTKPHVNVSADRDQESGNQAVTGRITGVAADPNDPPQRGKGKVTGRPPTSPAVTQPPSVSQKSAGGRSAESGPTINLAQPDLMIKQFLFPPTNDKAVRVQVLNQGNAASVECRLILTIRKINGTAAGRQTHVAIPSLAPGKTVWLVVDAKTILPNNVSLEATAFKLNADATGIVAESDEDNNEVKHND
jgi:hypothetical protein